MTTTNRPARLGSAAAADVSLAEIRGRRQRLAAAVASALRDLERHPPAAFPNGRQAQRAHEQQVLEQALAALLTPAPEPELPKNSAERELAATLRCLDAELELHR
jgi:hypothetical protein